MPYTESELIHYYEQLDNALSEFLLLIQRDDISIQLINPPESQSAITSLSRVITDIWYRKKGDGRRTENLYGLVGVPAAYIPLLHQLNQKKHNFQHAVKQYKSESNDLQTVLYKRASELNHLLETSGLARLHLKQCYRTIPVLDKCPSKVTFSWYSSGRSLRRISVDDALKRLLQMDQSQTHIQMQIQALNKLHESEQLVQIQTQVPVMRANVVWKSDNEITRLARNCPLPIFFPIDEGVPFPEYNKPPPTPPEARSRRTRADALIDEEPYLPSLRIHRYKK